MKTQNPERVLRIGLALDLGMDFGHLIAAGVGRYLAENPGWRVILTRMRLEEALHQGERRDGMIVSLPGKSQPVGLAGLAYPVVNVSGSVDQRVLPSVVGDDTRAGVLVAEHLIEVGYSNFALLYPDNWHRFGYARNHAFRERVESEGFACEAYHERHEHLHEPPKRREALEEIALELEAGTAVMAAADWLAAEFVEACLAAGRRVPEDLAVAGIGNDRYYTELTQPQITSVDTAAARRGYEAMALLRRLIEGRPAPEGPILIPPRGITARRSTEKLGTNDPLVMDAVHFIREHAPEPIVVEDVMEAVTCSRRTLENRFKRELGRSIHQELWRVRIGLAEAMLRDTDLSLLQVALRSGFAGASAFSTVFKRWTGTTPTAYRREHRHGHTA